MNTNMEQSEVVRHVSYVLATWRKNSQPGDPEPTPSFIAGFIRWHSLQDVSVQQVKDAIKTVKSEGRED